VKTATYIRDIDGMRGIAKLYRLSEPAPYDDGTTAYVVVSKVDHWTTETYIFPANEKGNIIDWGKLDGSQKGDVSHEQALHDAGYEVV